MKEIEKIKSLVKNKSIYYRHFGNTSTSLDRRKAEKFAWSDS